MTVHGTEQLAPRDDKDVVLAAVTQHGYALQYASADLQNDKDVVLAAVTQEGYALYYASAEVQNDKDVVLAANIVPKIEGRSTGFCLRKWLGAITLAALLLTHQ